MKELTKISFRFLIRNKKRTIFSIVGTILSVILMMSIVFLMDSYKNYNEKFNLYKNGSWLLKKSVPSETNLDEVISLSPIKDTLVISDMGVSLLPDNTYIEILGYSDFNEIYPFHIIDGRKPENENEIAVSEQYIKEKKVSVNDQLELAVGNRYIQEKEEIKVVNNYYDLLENEYFKQEKVKSYRIVGVYKDVSLKDNATAIQYQFITKSSQASPIYITYYTIQDISEDTWNEIVSNIKPADMNCVNETAIDLYVDKGFQLSIAEIIAYSLIILLIGLNMIAFIKNIFDISLKERMRTLGAMECIGATPSQLRTMILFEALMIGIIAIPLGIIICSFILSSVLKIFNRQIIVSTKIPVEMVLTIHPLHLVVIVAVVLFMLIIAALIPFLKIADFSPIQLMHRESTGKEQKQIKYKKYRKNIKIEKLIGLRNRKANKKAHRSIIFSLSMSIILFISGNYYINGEITSISQYQFDQEGIQVILKNARNRQQLDASMKTINELFALNKDGQNKYNYRMGTNIHVPESYWNSEAKEIFLKDTQNFMNIEIISDGSVEEMDKNKIDAEIYNCVTYQMQNKKKVEVKLLDSSENQQLSIPYSYIKRDEFLNDYLDVSIHSLNRKSMDIYYEQNDQLPALVMNVSLEDFIQLYTKFNNQSMYIDAIQTINMYTDHQETLLKNIKEYEETHIHTIDSVYLPETDSVSSDFIVQRILCNIFSVFLLFISGVNILHIVISGILIKKKEIAALQSIGMESRQIFNMIFYENIVYTLKALCIALPTSILLNYIIYMTLLTSLYIFDISIFHIFIVIIILLCTVLIVSYVGWKKILRDSIIEKIRNSEWE